MLRFARRAVVAAAVLLASLIVSGPAMAAAEPTTPVPSSSTPAGPTGYACLDQENGYEASGVCQLIVVKAVAVCREGVPWLDYAVEPQGTPNTTTTIVWGDASGPHSFTQAGQPLTGSVLWPGAAVDSQGNPISWPGWVLVNGQWVQGGPWTWVRPTVQVTFHVNPQATVTVAYPPEQAPCANPPTAQVLAAEAPSSAALAATGSNVGPLVLGAVAVLLVGSLLLGARARARRRAATR